MEQKRNNLEKEEQNRTFMERANDVGEAALHNTRDNMEEFAEESGDRIRNIADNVRDKTQKTVERVKERLTDKE